MREDSISDIISVLSRRYHAVYYVDAIDKTFDIVYQEGHVKKEVNPVITEKPKFADAMRMFVNNFVHPDDIETMNRLISSVYERLEHSSGFRHEFRRNYNGTFLYTEMAVAKVEPADEPLKHFVVGFSENDTMYQMLMDQQRQLESLVTDRTTELRERNRLLNQINEDVIGLFGSLTEARDLNSGEHVRRVKNLVSILAKQVQEDWPEYGLTDERIELLTSASILHDIGKIMIPDAILLKPGPLTDEEFDIMKTHCEKGCEILQQAPKGWSESYIQMSYDIIRFHHEKYDGRGYPDHLVGDNIPLSAQIVSIADCFDALTSDRPYKKAFSIETAFDMILEGKCGAMNPKLLESMLNCKKNIIRLMMDTTAMVESGIPAGISTESLSWATVLIAEGNAMGLLIGREMLEGEGAKVITATTGKEAIEKFKYMPEGGIDAIVMDISLPDEGGIETTRAIRALDRSDAKTVPIIALLSTTTRDDIEGALAAGMNSSISRPVSVSSFTKVFYECLNEETETAAIAMQKAADERNQVILDAIKRNPRFNSISTDFSLIAYVDGNTNEVTIQATDELKDVMDSITTKLPGNRRLDVFFNSIIPKDQFKDFLHDVDRNRLIRFMRSGRPINVFFSGKAGETEKTYRLRFMEDSGKSNCYLLGIQSVDSELRGEIRAQGLIEKLTESYKVVDYIDLENDTYQKYHEEIDQQRHLSQTGSFSKRVNEYIDAFVMEKERNKVKAFADIENLKNLMRRQKKASIRYRDTFYKKPRYYEMSVINANEDANGRYAIFLVSDIDDDVRTEAETRKLLEETRSKLSEIEEKAYTDPLTGVNNITAFADTISQLSEEMRSNDDMKFAIVMCDINDLKSVNDKNGHDIGDIYIKNNAAIMKNVFRRSKIFRTGGDEFVILITGDEYDYRDALLEQLHQEIKAAKGISDIRDGRASFAFGMSTYDEETDNNVSEVVKRADMNMYEHKKESKRTE